MPVIRQRGLQKQHAQADANYSAGGAGKGGLDSGSGAGSSPTAGRITLVDYLKQAGRFFGKDPTKWEKLGDDKVSYPSIGRSQLNIYSRSKLALHPLDEPC